MKSAIFVLCLAPYFFLGCESAMEPIVQSRPNVEGKWQIISGPIVGTLTLVQSDTVLTGILVTPSSNIGLLGVVISRRIVLMSLEFMPGDPKAGQRTQGFDLQLDESQNLMRGKYSLMVHNGFLLNQMDYEDIVCSREIPFP